jgi:hypothetical protein
MAMETASLPLSLSLIATLHILLFYSIERAYFLTYHTALAKIEVETFYLTFIV